MKNFAISEEFARQFFRDYFPTFRMLHRLTLQSLILLFSLSLFSQSENQGNQADYQLRIVRANAKITVDGDLTEVDWQAAEVAKDFWQKWPIATEKAVWQTEARLTYDEHFLYVGVVCYDTGRHVIQTLKRDVDYWDSDGIAVLLDPIGQKSNGFFFAVTPVGVQAEALTGGFDEPNFNWDTKWHTETRQYPDRWTAEMAIPFKVLRFEQGKKQWGVNFIRNDRKHAQYHTWTKVPQQFPGFDLGYAGALLWDEAPKRPGRNVALIPYASASLSDDYETGKTGDAGFNAGLDAKIAVSSSLNLDLALNPDFSQVEVDEQQTNLTRFLLFYPEKRTFFLENVDLLRDFGIPPVRPFFSRSIGLDADGNAIPILFGARLSGNLDKKSRVNLMNVHTQTTDASGPGANYTAAAFQRRLFDRSQLKGYFLNRQGFDKKEILYGDYGRNAGGEAVFQTANGKYLGWLGYHQSWKPGLEGLGFMGNAGTWLNFENLEILLDGLRMGENFYADQGFVNRIENYDPDRDTTIRLGYWSFFNEITYRIFPKTSAVFAVHAFGSETFLVFDADGAFNERSNRLRYSMNFKNSSELTFRLNNNRLVLPFRLDFFEDAEPLPTKLYDFWDFNLEYESDNRKALACEVEASVGEFYNGRLLALSAALRLRAQPWGNFLLGTEQNWIRFPDPHGKGTLNNIFARLEFSFSKKLFWTTFLQYNTQEENFGMNSRLQWRYAPMSDVYLVYTDNYLAEQGRSTFQINRFAPRNRSVVLKVSYWLNL